MLGNFEYKCWRWGFGMVSAECLGCTTRLNYVEQLWIQMLKSQIWNGQCWLVGLHNPIELCWTTLNFQELESKIWNGSFGCTTPLNCAELLRPHAICAMVAETDSRGIGLSNLVHPLSQNDLDLGSATWTRHENSLLVGIDHSDAEPKLHSNWVQQPQS